MKMGRIFIMLALLALVVVPANATLKLWYQMNSADDFNLGQNCNPASYDGRMFVTNNATGVQAAGMTTYSGVQQYDAAQGALWMDGDGWANGIVGKNEWNTFEPAINFASKTQYTFSVTAKAFSAAGSPTNSYAFYMHFTDGSMFKADLTFRADAHASFTAPSAGAAGYEVWNPSDARYVDPTAWNQYTYTWNADTDYVGVYVNGVLKGQHVAAEGAINPIAAGATVDAYGFGDAYFCGQPPKGWFKDFAIWDTALTGTDVANVYANGIPEPATMILLSLGSLMALKSRKRG